MGTEILHPQDCFSERLGSVHVIPTHGRRQPFRNPNPRSSRRTSPRSESRRRDPRKPPNPNLVMGQVTILKRGESLEARGIPVADGKKAVFFDDRDLIVTGTERLGPEPASVKKQVRMTDLKNALSSQCDVYAGSAFSQSPSPSSLPLPTFSRRKEGVAVVEDSATKDLRRLLRIA